MTDKEAEELIAEFNNSQRMKNTREYGYLGIDNFNIEEVIKIIKRFANKPPECGLNVPIFDTGDGSILANMNLKLRDKERVEITIKNTCQRDQNFISLRSRDVIILRDHCEKMLEYLDNQEVDTYEDIVQGHQL